MFYVSNTKLSRGAQWPLSQVTRGGHSDKLSRGAQWLLSRVTFAGHNDKLSHGAQWPLGRVTHGGHNYLKKELSPAACCILTHMSSHPWTQGHDQTLKNSFLMCSSYSKVNSFPNLNLTGGMNTEIHVTHDLPY